jgi:hypothetical protein
MIGIETASIRTPELQKSNPLNQSRQLGYLWNFDPTRRSDTQIPNSGLFLPKNEYNSDDQVDTYYAPEFWLPQKKKVSNDILLQDMFFITSIKQHSDILSFFMLDSMNEYIDDAKSRYKRLNSEDIDDSFAKRIYDVLCDSFLFVSVSRIAFFKNRVKVRLVFNQREYRINYDASDPGCIFIITEKDGVTVVDECIPEDLVKTLREF